MSIPGFNPIQPAPTVVETLTVKVDGREVTVPKTTPDPLTGKPVAATMIKACEIAGVVVPHYCYHARLPIAGNCRMCLVEFGSPMMGPDRKPILNPDGTTRISKSPRPAIACATPISPGMEIYTNTPTVVAMRRGVLEFLLINHPLDCPICDQAGECKLQEYSIEFGQSTSQFIEAKVHKPKQVELGPRIMLDDERCILCTRCIRFTRDVVHDDKLGIVNRGSYNTIAAYPGTKFDNNYTLNTVDICPVGALTSKDFRFQMRVWFLKETKSICTSCATGCNIVISSRENNIYRYEPRENDAVNSCWMCDSGRLNYKWIGRADRLKEVKKRVGKGASETISWATAAAEIAERLQKTEPGTAAIIASARQTNEELWLLGKLKTRLKAQSDSVFREGDGDNFLLSMDLNPNSVGARVAGICYTEVGINIPKIAEGIRKGAIKTLIVFGEDVTKQGIGADLLEKLDLLVVSDILPNATTEKAHYLLPGCAHAEKRGSFTNIKGRVQRFVKAVETPGDARTESEFLAELATLMDRQALPANPEGLFNQMAREVPAYSGLTWAGLGDLGTSISL